MVISDSYKYIFIEVPKTGSTSLKKYLLEIDKNATENLVPTENGTLVKVNNHITLSNLKSVMGLEFNKYKTVGFVREPYSKIVSNFFFYKNGRALKRVNREIWPNAKNSLLLKLRVRIANLLPFFIWAIFYPYKSNWHFVQIDGNLGLDYLGRFSSLEKDFFYFFGKMGIKFNSSKLPHYNVSNHRNPEVYYNGFLKKIIRTRINKDLLLCKEADSRLQIK